MVVLCLLGIPPPRAYESIVDNPSSAPWAPTLFQVVLKCPPCIWDDGPNARTILG